MTYHCVPFCHAISNRLGGWCGKFGPNIRKDTCWINSQISFFSGNRIIIFINNNSPQSQWPLGRVIEVFVDERGFVRFVLSTNSNDRYTNCASSNRLKTFSHPPGISNKIKDIASIEQRKIRCMQRGCNHWLSDSLQSCYLWLIDSSHQACDRCMLDSLQRCCGR